VKAVLRNLHVPYFLPPAMALTTAGGVLHVGVISRE